MGNDELDERRRVHIADADHDAKDGKAPRSPHSASALDENRNKKQLGHNENNNLKTTRFSFDKTEISTVSSNASSSPRLPVTPKRTPSWLTRKSADWGANHVGGVKASVAAGHRRQEVMIVLMGSSRVGKSAIVNQFLHNIFRHDYTATVDELHWIEYDAPNYQTPQEQKLDNGDHNAGGVSGTLLLKLMDASGSHEFIGMRKLYEQQGDAFILVISVDDPASFDEAKIIRQEIAERNTKRAPVICVLNKSDLPQRSENSVAADDVSKFALANQCLFVSVTATEHDSVAEIFKRLLQQNSIVPSASQLKYRRKSVPITVTACDFGDHHIAMKKVIGQHRQKESGNKKCLKAISETNPTAEDEKRYCVIS